MPEHMPAPTFSRAVYGFVLYLTLKTLFVLYLIWAFLPDWTFHYFNISYVPQKYWAIGVPILCLNLIAIFAFFIYPGFNLCMTPSGNDMRTIRDCHAINSIRRNQASALALTKCSDRMKLRSQNGTLIKMLPTDVKNGLKTKENLARWSSIDRDDKMCSCKYIQRCSKYNTSSASSQKKCPPHLNYSVPPVHDLNISDVCKNFYL